MSTRPIHHLVIMDGQAADETTSTVIGSSIASQVQQSVFYVVWSAGVSAGVVQIEAAHREDYTGTWASVGTVTFATASTVHRVNVTGVHLALRARISTAVAGGTVDVIFGGN